MKVLEKIIFFWLFVALLVGCRPRGVISDAKMRDVLYDLHRADGAIQVAGYNYSHDQEVAGYYKNVLDKHGITQAEFDSSLVWYTDNPQIFNKIYPKVVERLEADYDRLKAIRDTNVELRRSKRQVKADPAMQKEIDNLLKCYIEPPQITLKSWEVEEFCEKNVIIFGQLEKK